MQKVIASLNIEVNDEGYLTDFSQWNKAIGEEIALYEGIVMTDEHWKVIEYLQDQHRKNVPLSIRKIGKSGVVAIKDFYRLFPKGPLKISSKIAGIPKPVSCV
ncbi:MAG: TusE/DsrC/DsvC family sulfur relay protein [Bacteroidetes bacterium]|nr:TusE/DsrC/DsvC family sulfur relay protein [Bacteroidota bacterium]MCB0854094.1 TusE/DsrC/DsvC family sulfur relay protein [Bacteroidota bacterium]